MATPLTQAHAMGLLCGLERQVDTLQKRLQAGEARAQALSADLTQAAQRLRTARAGLQASRDAAQRAASIIADSNAEVASLSREVVVLQRRVDGFTAAARATKDADAQLALRRSRATVSLQLEERRKKLGAHQAKASAARAQLHDARGDQVRHADGLRHSEQEVAALQAQLPPPSLYLRLFEAQAGQLHCRLLVEGDAGAWRRDLAAATAKVEAIHTALRGGHYPLEQSSELGGGRAHGTVEALQARVVLGDWQGARRLFAVATDPSLFFHAIFNVFKVWCVGLYVEEQYAVLAEMLRLHTYAQGPRGHYARAYTALLQRDGKDLAAALVRLVQADWEAWRRLPQRGLGVVNLGALTLCRLAEAGGLRWQCPELGPTVPRVLLQPAAQRRGA